MASHIDSIPTSGIILIRDLMYSVERPFRLDQGDMSFDAPESLKAAMHAAIDANHTHYLQTAGLPRLQQLLAAKLRAKNGIPVESPDEVHVTNGGVHGLYLACQALVDPGDEVLVPDPIWPQMYSCLVAAGAAPVRVPLHAARGWRFDADELERLVTPKTRGLYLNSPHNPTGGVLTADDLERVAAIVRDRGLWVIADEAYEDVVFDGTKHLSLAAYPGMHDRTVSMFTFSKTYAITGVRLGYLVVKAPAIQDRVRKLLGLTTNNVSSIAQYGGIGALEGSQAVVEAYRAELEVRRNLFYDGIARVAAGVFGGEPPKGAFYGFLRIDPAWQPPSQASSGQAPPPGAPTRRDEPAQLGGSSRSWAMVEYLIARGRIGCVPGVDFGLSGEGYVRFCFARSREEIKGALDSMAALFA